MSLSVNSCGSGPALQVVRCASLEQKQKLKGLLFEWMEDVATLRALEWVYSLPNKEEPPEDILADAHDVLHLIGCSFLRFNRYRYISVEDASGTTQGVGVFSKRYTNLDYLVTAPTNLRIRSQSNFVKGIGTALLQDGIRRCLKKGGKQITTYSLNSSKGFYLHNGFVPSDKNDELAFTLTLQEPSHVHDRQ